MNRCTTCGCAIATGKDVLFSGHYYHRMCLPTRKDPA